ncbi:Stage II sporulation protein OS=Lysinibacillus sphaericus OX=1421 GN=LS41612_19960 PE=4 SV=1 [Lysinibacillus sphaericus]
MREDKNSKTSQNEKGQLQKKPWFWPAVYAGGALMLAGMLFGYNSLVTKEEAPLPDVAQVDPSEVVETNAKTETMKYPFKEAELSKVQVSQEFYDVESKRRVT